MTKLFERAVRTARSLTPEMQDDIARVVLTLAGDDQPIAELTPAEEASFARSRKQAAQREFATETEVEAVWSKHGL